MFAAALASLALLAASVQAAPISSEATLAKIAASLSLPTTNQTNAVEWYAQNGNQGACGLWSKDTDLVVGLPTEFYYDLDSVSTYCGAYIVINSAITGQNVTARVEDASAANETLSVSIAVWDALKGDETDLTEVTWVFADASEIAAATAASSSSAAPASTQASSSAKASSTQYSQPKATTTTTSSAYKTTTTTKAYVAPSSTKVYTTSNKPTTTTTTTTKAAASTSAAAKKASTESSSSSSSSTYTGYATFFTQGGVAGACGTVHSDSDYIIALDSAMYGSGEYCGKSLTIHYNGKSVTATVADECPTCASSTSIDLSVAAFTSLASEDVGEMQVTWGWN